MTVGKTSLASVGLLVVIGLTMVSLFHTSYSIMKVSAELKVLHENRHRAYRMAAEVRANAIERRNQAGTYASEGEPGYEQCPCQSYKTLVPVTPR